MRSFRATTSGCLSLLVASLLASPITGAAAHTQVKSCDAAGIGAAALAADGVKPSITSKRGGKLVVWHGWSDPLINGTGSVDYYDRVVKEMGGLKRTQEFARLYMAPGVGHCSGGPGHQPQHAFDAVVNWVEKGIAPDTLPASRTVQGTVQTRPLCPYPAVARWDGRGSVDDAASYSCAAPRH